MRLQREPPNPEKSHSDLLLFRTSHHITSTVWFVAMFTLHTPSLTLPENTSKMLAFYKSLVHLKINIDTRQQTSSFSFTRLFSNSMCKLPLFPRYNPQKTMFRRLRQSAEQASTAAWAEDQATDKDEWKRRHNNGKDTASQANFTGTWRLNASESDSLWTVCAKLGCPWFVRPFIDSSYLSLVTIVKHDPIEQSWHEEMIKARYMSFDNDLFTDGRAEVWPSTFDPAVKVHLNTWCDEDGGIVTVLEHGSQSAVQRLTRRINESSDVVMITNVFSFMNEEGVIETSVHRSKFERDESKPLG